MKQARLHDTMIGKTYKNNARLKILENMSYLILLPNNTK